MNPPHIINNSIKEDIQRIIDVVKELQTDSATVGSIREQVAATFVLDDMTYLPSDYYNLFGAWEMLGGTWQGYLRDIKQYNQALIRRC